MTEPTDDEIDALVAAYLGDCGPQATRVYSFARAVLAKWGTPQADYEHGPQSKTVQEAARHVGKWLNERPNRPIDLRDVAMLSAHAQAADSQPARDYPPLPDFDTVEQHIYGACRRYITQDMLEPIHNLIRDAIDADRAKAFLAAEREDQP